MNDRSARAQARVCVRDAREGRRTGVWCVAAAAALVAACLATVSCAGSGGGGSGILFVNATGGPLTVAGPGDEVVRVEPGKSATAAAWADAGALAVMEEGGSTAAYQVPLTRRGPLTITARGPRGQVAFDVSDPRQTTSAQDRQIQRDVIDRPRGTFNR